MTAARVLCGCCRRLVPVRGDGKVRAHLAVLGRRGQCHGSGMPSARMEISQQAGGAALVPVDPWTKMTPAEQFNAADAWALVDALYDDYVTMRDAGCATPDAIEDAKAAFWRADAAAKALAPLGMTWAPQDGADCA